MPKFTEGNKASKGRPKGTPNKRTLEFQAVLEKHGFNAAEALIEIYSDARKIFKSYAVIYAAISEAREIKGMVPVEDKASQYLKVAADVAKDLASYSYAKRKSIEQSIDPEVAATLERLDKLSDEELRAIVNGDDKK